MEILKKLLDLILEFLNNRKETQHRKEEIDRVDIEQTQKTKKVLDDRKNEIIKAKPPTDDNFFND